MRAAETRRIHVILADAARQTRSTLRQCRLPVDPNLDQLAARRKGAVSARQLALLTDEMISAEGPDGAKRRLAEMGAQMVDARMAG